MQFDRKAADAWFALAKQHFGCMLACEARHPSWFDEPATAALTPLLATM